MTGRGDIEAAAAHWVARMEEAGWSDLDQADLERWLEASLAHKAAFWRLEAGWRLADRLAALGRHGRSDEPVQYAPSRPHAIAASLAAFLVAAGILLVLAWSRPAETGTEKFATPVGGRKLVGLSDGSRIDMNTASRIDVSLTPKRRDVWLLKGEAYFEVAKNPRRPFIVHAADRAIVVLGTRFSVRLEGPKVTVAVLEGRVRIDRDRRAPAEAVATGGELAIASGDSTLVAGGKPGRVDQALAWRQGLLQFDSSPLGDIASEFNRYSERPIVVADPSLAGLRLSGTFRAGNSDGFVRLLHDAYGLQVEQRPNEIVITGG